MATTSTSRVEFRLPPNEKELIDQAVELLGTTLSEFARPRLLQEARRILAEHATARLTDRDRDTFLAMLDADAEPNAALKKAFQEVK